MDAEGKIVYMGCVRTLVSLADRATAWPHRGTAASFPLAFAGEGVSGDGRFLAYANYGMG
jgi:hypothetical protein